MKQEDVEEQTVDENDLEIMKEIMRFKSLEGTVEAGPQLVLQLYIITRIGLNLDKTEGEK